MICNFSINIMSFVISRPFQIIVFVYVYTIKYEMKLMYTNVMQ